MQMIEDKFFNTNNNPNITKPVYPYVDVITNLEIYWQLSDDLNYKEWFIYSNEDLYDSIMMQSQLVEDIDCKIKKWFENNYLIMQYKLAYTKYMVEGDRGNQYLVEKERNKNCKRAYPLSRL
jgi:hypothetical protein